MSEKEEGKDKSAVVRELIRYGEIYRAVKKYKEGKFSLGRMSSELDVSLADVMDLLRELGVKVKIDYDEYLEGKENLEEVW